MRTVGRIQPEISRLISGCFHLDFQFVHIGRPLWKTFREKFMRKYDNITLIGMPGAGKSTIGVVLAKRLGYRFVDTDLLIQEQEHRLLKEIIAEDGLEGFKRIENQVNTDLEVEHSVIAPGGSVIYCEEAMEHLKKLGLVVYLRVSYEELAARLGDLVDRGVALKEGQGLKELMEERGVQYEKYADYIIDEEGLTPGRMAAILEEKLKSWTAKQRSRKCECYNDESIRIE